MASPKCLRCGTAWAVSGALHVLGRASFRPSSTKFLTLETSDVMTRATMCPECGFIEVTGDVKKLRRLTSQAETPSGQTPQPA